MNSIYNSCPCNSGKKFKFCCHAVLNNANHENFPKIVSALPLHTCFSGTHWKSQGIANVAVVRAMPLGNFIAGVYLVDMWCLGVKDAFLRINITQGEINEMKKTIGDCCMGLRNLSYEDARSLILGSIKYAASIGFSPHKDWELAQHVVEPNRAFEDKFEFGKDGKPFYIAGPYDSDVRDEYAKRASKAGGYWMIPLDNDIDELDF